MGSRRRYDHPDPPRRQLTPWRCSLPYLLVFVPHVEPGLPAALKSLSEAQGAAEVLVYVLEWIEREAAELLEA